jgi:hypothetical protein
MILIIVLLLSYYFPRFRNFLLGRDDGVVSQVLLPFCKDNFWSRADILASIVSCGVWGWRIQNMQA